MHTALSVISPILGCLVTALVTGEAWYRKVIRLNQANQGEEEE